MWSWSWLKIWLFHHDPMMFSTLYTLYFKAFVILFSEQVLNRWLKPKKSTAGSKIFFHKNGSTWWLTISETSVPGFHTRRNITFPGSSCFSSGCSFLGRLTWGGQLSLNIFKAFPYILVQEMGLLPRAVEVSLFLQNRGGWVDGTGCEVKSFVFGLYGSRWLLHK